MTQAQVLSPQEEFDQLNAQITSITAQQAELEDRAVMLNDSKLHTAKSEGRTGSKYS